VVEFLLQGFVDRVVTASGNKRKAPELDTPVTPAMDVADAFLADSLRKAVEKRREPPPGMMGSAELKKIAELVEGVKTLQAGGLLGASPGV